jgi:phosphoribosylformimino-5-aminoimidazole carboxamide ribotide isomerase
MMDDSTAASRAFHVIPAIDLAGGRVVRLVQGRFDQVTAFGDDPLAVARGFWGAGARTVHVIDLDAARTGVRSAAHRALLERLARECPADGVLQVGGGFRDEAAVDDAVRLGVDRVLVGTLAFRDPAALGRLVARHGERIFVTADTKDGSVWIAGWTEDAGLGVAEAVTDLTRRGVRGFLATAIARDGTLAGPDLRLLRTLRKATTATVLASGGVGTLAHVKAVRQTGVDGVVAGRALLSGALDLAAALAI